MKRLLTVILAALMAGLMAVILPLQAFAEGQQTYVSEVVIETGSTADEAKQKLTNAGYLVYDKNISNTTNGDGKSGYMYIGYKTTNDKNEALTDIRLMHMGGGYSYTEYEQLIKQKTKEISDLVGSLEGAVSEYIANYAANKNAAIVAHNMLNQFVEDDSGVLMGDYLLDTSKTKDDFTNLFLQTSTAVLITVARALAIACSATNEGAIFDLADLDKEDFVGETQYDVIASDIYENIPYIQTSLSVYANSGLADADADTVDAAYNALTDDDEKIAWTQSFSLALTLQSIELADGTTLYDLLMTDVDEIVNDDLYPLASLLSAGQASVLGMAGLESIITAAVMSNDQWTDIDQYSYTVEEPISVYTGVDRSLFEGGVALTSKAMVEAAANTERAWYFSLSSDDLYYKIMSISAMTLIGAGALYLSSWTANTIASKIIIHIGDLVINHGGAVEMFAATLIKCNLVMEICRYVGIALTAVMVIAIGVCLIVAAIYLISAGIEYYNPTYDEIPRILVEKGTDAKGETIYTYYYGVKNTSGKLVDINQHDASRWMTLYSTKDQTAGKPILADFEIGGNNLLDGYIGVRKFSQNTAFSLNKFSYNLDDTITRDGTSVKITDSYLFYKQDTSNTYGSIFNTENALIAVCSLALGLVAGIAGTVVYNKKKKPVVV